MCARGLGVEKSWPQGACEEKPADWGIRARGGKGHALRAGLLGRTAPGRILCLRTQRSRVKTRRACAFVSGTGVYVISAGSVRGTGRTGRTRTQGNIFADVNRFVYIGVWEDGLVDVWQEVEDTVGDPIFQQDGAKIHSARDTMAWFAGNNIQVMEWPLNSPDLNPIENCWKRLKEKLHQRFPNIHKTKGGPDTIRRCLVEALDVVWTKDIEGDFLESV